MGRKSGKYVNTNLRRNDSQTKAPSSIFSIPECATGTVYHADAALIKPGAKIIYSPGLVGARVDAALHFTKHTKHLQIDTWHDR